SRSFTSQTTPSSLSSFRLAIILKALFIFPGEYQLEKPIKAQVGSDVILPCLVKPPVNVRDAAVEWMFDSSKTVHLFRNEADDRESQDDRYKGRTYLNHTMLELGNISLKLSNVTKNDEGIYSCFVHRLPDLSEEKHVTLIVVNSEWLHVNSVQNLLRTFHPDHTALNDLIHSRSQRTTTLNYSAISYAVPPGLTAWHRSTFVFPFGSHPNKTLRVQPNS
uniref:Ig-like domain-containing protein n=1 Tax=Xiphophorus couchianus TaxID=32473 RepID=A0A3B5LTE6_9TELE